LIGNWLLAAGPTFYLPDCNEFSDGENKWQVGPAAAVGYMGKNFITYVFPQQWFSVGGRRSKDQPHAVVLRLCPGVLKRIERGNKSQHVCGLGSVEG
jgi:hypothetical protein